MEVIQTEIPAVKILAPKRHGDNRGFFSEVYNRKALCELAGIDVDFVQDNHSLSAEKCVVRGLHYQLPPMALHKLVRVVRGSILDVAVDIRRDSPTFGKHVKAILSAENWRQLFVPIGFAHGFVTLEANTEVCYKVSDYWSAELERGIRFDDPQLNIEWGIESANAILSKKDAAHPLLPDVRDLF